MSENVVYPHPRPNPFADDLRLGAFQRVAGARTARR